MAMILEFPKRIDGCNPNGGSAPIGDPSASDRSDWSERSAGASGEVVLFTGVRYSRWDAQQDDHNDADTEFVAG